MSDMRIASGVPVKPQYALMAIKASLVTVVLLIVIKSFAFWFSGAASILASLIDSVVDAGVSFMTFWALHYSLKPPDHEHRYGHGKIEGLAALFQAAFITGAALFLLLESINRFTAPNPVTHFLPSIGIMTVTIIISLILVGIQRYALRKAPSLAVEADSVHYAMDIVINAGVIVILTALYFGAPAWIDPVFALAVAFYLGATVLTIARKGIDMLLDREINQDFRTEIANRILAHPGVLGLHDLRTYQSGMRVFISFDIEVEAQLSLLEAHEIARNVEVALVADYPHAEIMIHVDPHNDRDDTRHQVAGVHH